MALSLLVATTVTTDENVTAECHKKIRHNNVTDFPFSFHPLPAAVEQHPDRGVFIVDFTEIQVFVDCINFGIARQGDHIKAALIYADVGCVDRQFGFTKGPSMTIRPALSIHRKSLEQCQSIQSGHYVMQKKMKYMDEKDTVLTISPAISGKSPMTRYSENTFP